MPGATPVCKNWIPLATPMIIAILCGHLSISLFLSSVVSRINLTLGFSKTAMIKKKKKIKWCLLFYQLGNLLEIHWRCVQGQQILCQLGSNDPDMWRWCVRECWPNADASALIVPQSAESCFEANSSALVSHISPGLLNHLWDNLYRAVDYSTE